MHIRVDFPQTAAEEMIHTDDHQLAIDSTESAGDRDRRFRQGQSSDVVFESMAAETVLSGPRAFAD